MPELMPIPQSEVVTPLGEVEGCQCHADRERESDGCQCHRAPEVQMFAPGLDEMMGARRLPAIAPRSKAPARTRPVGKLGAILVGALAVVGLVLTLAGLVPVLFIGLVLLLVGLAPILLVVLCILATEAVGLPQDEWVKGKQPQRS